MVRLDGLAFHRAARLNGRYAVRRGRARIWPAQKTSTAAIWTVPCRSGRARAFLDAAVDAMAMDAALTERFERFSVGLTGGIGSGKTVVAQRFAQHGVTVIDTDRIAHALTAAGGAAMPQITRAFGRTYLTAGSALDRATPTHRAGWSASLHSIIACRPRLCRCEVDCRCQAGHTYCLRSWLRYTRNPPASLQNSAHPHGTDSAYRLVRVHAMRAYPFPTRSRAEQQKPGCIPSRYLFLCGCGVHDFLPQLLAQPLRGQQCCGQQIGHYAAQHKNQCQIQSSGRALDPFFGRLDTLNAEPFDHLAKIAAAAAVIDQAIRQLLTEQARIKCFAIVLCAGGEPINHFRTVPAQPRRTARLELFQRSDQGFSGHQ